MTLNSLANQLIQYAEQEAKSIIRILLQDCFGWSYTDICSGVLDNINPDQYIILESLIKRLQEGEPVQYVTGKAEFYDRTFHVEPGVLIPRPETEELITLVKQEHFQNCNILDIGTGSGCIAITLAKEIEDARVSAWDISEEALRIAKHNAEELNAEVSFVRQDALNCPDDNEIYDVIVSNPPYICNKETKDMETNVLDYEPHIALFVPDDKPLLFYRKITQYAKNALTGKGLLAFELNAQYAEETRELVSNYGFQVAIHQDQFGKARFLLAHKKSPFEEQTL